MLTTVERLCFSTSTFCLLHLFSVKTCLSSPVTPCYETHISGGVPWWNNEIRGISFITDSAILFQSPLFTRPAEGRKSRQISRLINWHPAPFFFSYLLSSPYLSASSLLFVLHKRLEAIIICVLSYDKWKHLLAFSRLSIFPSLIVHC